MLLHSKIIGQGDNILVILHGLFGSGDNWKTFANKLAIKGYCIHLVDQRNHGRSFHHNEFNYDLLVSDLKYYLDHYKINNCILLGHSMGGKTAMSFSLKYPENVTDLIVVDIAPKKYSIHHDTIVDALNSLDLDLITTRKDVDKKLSNFIDDDILRNFLLKNLYWIKKDKLAFRFNLESLTKNLSNVGDEIKNNLKFVKNTIFLRGEFSIYIEEIDELLISKIFPNSSVITVPNSNHWLHIDNPQAFFDIVTDFIKYKY
tara:strand:+ start:978 stop:1754 length:777 start_codon:yes stop_codon:yes gene_type:complete